MVRKKFIDKKSSTTYSLVYRSTDGADDDDGAAAEALAGAGRVLAAEGADRVLVAQPRAGGYDDDDDAGPSRPPAAGQRPPTQDPRALYRHFFGGDDDDGSGGARGGLSEAKRRELLSLGFPDDGYDYLKHMRVVGGAGGPRGQQQQRQVGAAGSASSSAGEAAAAAAAAARPGAAGGGEQKAEEQVVETVGPATFLRAPRLRAPAPDVKLVDARGVRTTAVAVRTTAVAAAADAGGGGGGGAAPSSSSPGGGGAGGGGEDVAELERELRAMGLGGAARAQLPARGALAAELAEVEAALEAEEEEDDEAALLAAEKEAAEAEAAEEQQQQDGAGGGSSARARGPLRRLAPPTATLEGRGDLEDDFLAFANAPAGGGGGQDDDDDDDDDNDAAPAAAARRSAAPPGAVVVGFDAPSDEDDGGGGTGRRPAPHPSSASQRATDASPTKAAEYAELNSQFDRLMQEEYEDDDDDDDEEEDDEDDEDGGGGGRRQRIHQRKSGARTVGEELTPARLAALLSGGVGGDEAPYDDSDDAYFDDEADGFGGDPAAAERARERRERQRLARERALAELEGCAPVVPNAARVATLDERDEEVLAATRARVAAAPRLRGDDEIDEKGRVLDGAGEVGQGDEPLETLHMRRVRDRWDCESVLSLRTTASFQPSRIGDGSGPGGRRPRSLASGAAAGGAGGAAGGGVIRLSQRTGLPAGYGPRAQGDGVLLEEVDEDEAEGYDEDEDEDMVGDDGVGGPLSSERRPRNETPEEKRARKGAAKAAQRAAREQKRQLKAAFREEAGKQRRQRAAVGAGSGASTFVIP